MATACFFVPGRAQESGAVKHSASRVDSAQVVLVQQLNSTFFVDSNDRHQGIYFVTVKIDSLQTVIRNDVSIPFNRKLLALDSELRLLEVVSKELRKARVNIFTLIQIRRNYLLLIERLLCGDPIHSVNESLNSRMGTIMADVFKAWPQSAELSDMATLKMLENTPEKIMNFLSVYPRFLYRDTLLYIYANTEPERFVVSATNTKDPAVTLNIQNHPSPLISTLLSIYKEKKFKHYLPFAGLLAQKKISLALIDSARKVPSQFFQLMVNAELDNQLQFILGKVPVYQLPLRNYLAQWARLFFINPINELHEQSNEKERFFVLENLRPQDLYLILISGENDLYTSSFLYTYHKLMDNFEKGQYDSLFRLVHYNRYRKFLSLAGHYNNLTSFVTGMRKDSAARLLAHFMGNLETRAEPEMEETITVAETFPGIINDDTLSGLAEEALAQNLDRTKAARNEPGVQVYSVLQKIFKAVRSIEQSDDEPLPAELAAYRKISHKSLRDNSDTIRQLVLFYGDEDGKNSFKSFLTNFPDKTEWVIEQDTSWITIRSIKGSPISIYANLPKSEEDLQDRQAQEELAIHLKKNGISISQLVHRGHSYHLPNSIKYLTPDVQLAILGSCGGYKEIFDVLDKSPAAQIISTKKIGTMQVTDPMLRIIYQKLLNKEDLLWNEIWEQLDKQLRSNKIVYDYFAEYIPPNKNIAMLVSRLYASYEEEGK